VRGPAGVPSVSLLRSYCNPRRRRSICNRITRLERRAGAKAVPIWHEYQSAKNPLLEGDTEEQRQRDRDIIVRYDRDALAEKARLRLQDVGRSG
jgi:hypothetical protein